MKRPDPVPWPPGHTDDLQVLAAAAPCTLVDVRGVRSRWDGKGVPSSWGPWRVAR